MQDLFIVTLSKDQLLIIYHFLCVRNIKAERGAIA